MISSSISVLSTTLHKLTCFLQSYEQILNSNKLSAHSGHQLIIDVLTKYCNIENLSAFHPTEMRKSTSHDQLQHMIHFLTVTFLNNSSYIFKNYMQMHGFGFIRLLLLLQGTIEIHEQVRHTVWAKLIAPSNFMSGCVLEVKNRSHTQRMKALA